MSRTRKLEQWIDRHHAAVFRHAYWMSGDRDRAADLVQETYYEAWKSLRRWNTPRQPLAWLLAILRRQAAKSFAQSQRLSALTTESAQGPEAAIEPDVDALLDLMTGLQRLSLEQREILLLYALHGFSYQEIAAQLDIPIGTVMSRLARARKALGPAVSRPSEGSKRIIPFDTLRRPG